MRYSENPKDHAFEEEQSVQFFGPGSRYMPRVDYCRWCGKHRSEHSSGPFPPEPPAGSAEAAAAQVSGTWAGSPLALALKAFVEQVTAPRSYAGGERASGDPVLKQAREALAWAAQQDAEVDRITAEINAEARSEVAAERQLDALASALLRANTLLRLILGHSDGKWYVAADVLPGKEIPAGSTFAAIDKALRKAGRS